MRDIGDVEEKEVEEKEVEEKPTTTNNKAALGVGIFLALVFTLVCGVMIGVLSIAGTVVQLQYENIRLIYSSSTISFDHCIKTYHDN